MVYLTITSTILRALEEIQSLESSVDEKNELRNSMDFAEGLETKEEGIGSKISLGDQKKIDVSEHKGDGELKEELARKSARSAVEGLDSAAEPSLLNPKLGNPISHDQVIDLSKKSSKYCLSPRSLDALLRGSRVHVAPPAPKPEPTSEYKALMARLRREEEARSYERMINPPPPMETFAQRFPMSSAVHAFPSYQEPEAEDEVTYAEINRQMALIFNVLISIVACAGAIWVAARWWSTPARLALSISGSLLVGVAEVVVYGGYIRRVGDAKGKEKSVREVKEVLRTWVVGGEEEMGHEHKESVVIEEKQDLGDIKARRRKKEIS